MVMVSVIGRQLSSSIKPQTSSPAPESLLRALEKMEPYGLCALLLMLGSVQSFLPDKVRHASRRPSPSLSLKQSSKSNELFDSPGWKSIKQELDQVPMFSVANAEGQPIKYRIEKKDESFEVPLFYTHVSDALAELEKAKKNSPLPGMDINPYPLGDIFEMWAKDSA